MVKDPSTLVDRANRYRQVAIIIRAQIPIMQSTEARDELAALAAGYESLARQTHDPKAD
jgi:hypothetical protein